MSNETLGFYNRNAAAYAANEGAGNPRLFSFLRHCPPGGKVLELGTGAGVDAAAMIQAAFDLDATDGSSALAAIASERLGRTVRTMLFDQLDAKEAYDGVYACASLTHVPRSDLPRVIQRVHRALRHCGVAWANFKAGACEGTDALGRHYSYLSEQRLLDLWSEAAPWASIETEAWLGGAYDGKETRWLAVTAIR
ncbi:SAM-dependent methyltransferase [Pseudorhizobium tarimense]|uniref:SAM-dependent methyltransferase n=1 Tax=Pseudorhizobium tarimense TaxID=1079109 RepID=A0ABV2H5V3_9HYPH|nr:class I SAM-dependent methyltransferase [Pseudorhizobium tarimense]MCJ8519232.1 class I SAM-dependent methyltransferase [Pseudorhizobium tarimense]